MTDWIPLLAVVAIFGSIAIAGIVDHVRSRPRRRHERALRNIARLERELGLAEPPAGPTGAPGEIWEISGEHLMAPFALTEQEASELGEGIGVSVDRMPWLVALLDAEVVPRNDRGPH